MTGRFLFSLTIVVLLSSAFVLAEEHTTKSAVTISTEGIFSEPYSRGTVNMNWKGLSLTGGGASSEGRKFGFALGGYQFKGESETNGEFFVEPHVGFAKGGSVPAMTVFGGRAELESSRWLAASWVDRFKGNGLSFTTCEPLAEISRHVWKGFYVGGTSSCYVGPENAEPEPHGRHEAAVEKTTVERLFFVGPTVAVRAKSLLLGFSYEVGKDGEKIAAGYFNYRFR